MVATYQINSTELDNNLINSIKSSFPNQEIVIDVYNSENIKFDVDEITNPEIIHRIKDIKSNNNLIFPKIDLSL